MNKKEKIRFSIVTILISILIILGIGTLSWAGGSWDANYKVKDLRLDKGFDIGYNEYNQKNLLCIQHKQKLTGAKQEYIVKALIHIDGKKATYVKEYKSNGEIKSQGKTIGGEDSEKEESEQNLRLAAAIYYSNPNKKYKYTNNGKTETATERQMAVWYYMHNWMQKVGKNFPGLDEDMTNDKDEGLNKRVRNRVENYVKKVNKNGNEGAYFTDQTDKDSQYVDTYTYNGTEYYRARNYKASFDPSLDEVKIYAKKLDGSKGSDITKKCKIRQDGEILDSVTDIESDVKFAVLVPKSLKNIKGIYSIEVKTEETDTDNATEPIVVDIAFLKCKQYGWQKLCLVQAKRGSKQKKDRAKGTLPGINFEEKGKGSIIIKKLDAGNNNSPMTDAYYGFKLYNAAYGWLIWSKNSGDSKATVEWTDDINQATIHYTLPDKDGCTEEITDLPKGTYRAEEVVNPAASRGYGDENPNKTVYVKEGTKGKKPDPVVFEKVNKRMYVSLKGYVWVDRPNGKSESRNDVYTNALNNDINDDNDQMLDGVTVAAWHWYKDSGGAVHTDQVQVVATGQNNWGQGNYVLDKIPISLLENATNENYLYLDFYYSGLDYATVTAHTWQRGADGQPITDSNGKRVFIPNTSKGFEVRVRRERVNNVYFNSIEKGEDSQYGITARNIGITRDESGNKQEKLIYHLDGNIAKFQTAYGEPTEEEKKADPYLQEAEVNNVWARLGEDQCENYGHGQKNDFKLGDRYKDLKDVYGDVTEITDLNLGLYERDKADMRLEKDIENVELKINDKSYVYEYDQKKNNPGLFGDNYFQPDSNVYNQHFGTIGVAFAYKFNEGYENVSYKRPIYKADYTWDGKDKDGNDTGKELKVYVTYKITLINDSTSVTTRVNSFLDYFDNSYDYDYSEVKIGDRITNNYEKERSAYGGFNFLKINEPITVSAKKDGQNYQEVFIKLKLTRQGVEDIIINDATDSEETKNARALKNITEITSYSNFKDGVHYATVDNDSAPGNAIPGDPSTYEDDTAYSPPLLLVHAIDRKINGQVFFDKTDKDDSNTVLTARIREGDGIFNDGESGISGVEIKLIEANTGYIYYIGNNNKDGSSNSVTGKNGGFEISGFIPGDYTIEYTWGKDKGQYDVQNYKGTVYNNSRNENDTLWYRTDPDIRYTDAYDDYETRQEIDDELKTLNFNNDGDYKITKNEMTSTTPKMDLGIEYDDWAKKNLVNNANDLNYTVKNVDFGIVRRAKQDVELTKKIKSYKVILANTEVISEIYYDGDGYFHKIGTHTTYGPRNLDNDADTKYGFVKTEMDVEIMEGARLYVTYAIKFENKSEVDIATEEYYKYGQNEVSTQNENGKYWDKDGKKIDINGVDIITTTPNYMIDFLDKNWGYKGSENPDWEDIDEKTLKARCENEEIFNFNYIDNKETAIKNRRILISNTDDKILPGDSMTKNVVASRLLSASIQELNFDNEVDLVQVSKTGGSKIDRLKGAIGWFVPGGEIKIPSSDKAEQVMITPHTGKDLNFVLPITIGVIALITLGAGVILIKKKVVDNK